MTVWKTLARDLQLGRELKRRKHKVKGYREEWHCFSIGGTFTRPPTDLAKLEHGSKILARVSLEEKCPHQHCHALRSRDTDPAARLAIHVSGENVAGEKFAG
jgi:hypothetical protein